MLDSDKAAEMYGRIGITRKDLFDLRRLCEMGRDGAAHEPSTVNSIERVLYRLLVEMKVASGSKIIDLGCGQGFPLMAFAYAGFRSYGVDGSVRILSNFARNVEDAPGFLEKEFEHRPQIALKNYFDENFHNFLFQDGTASKKMDVFFCFPYNGDHHEEVAASLRYAKDGAILALPQGAFDKFFLEEHDFRAFNPEDKKSFLVKDRQIG